MSKTPFDHALDLLVYAPLGVALAARDALPDLIDKGRERVTGQVTTARAMGQMAVSQGQRGAERAVTEATQRLAGLGLIPDGRRRASPAETTKPSEATVPTEATAPAGATATVTPEDPATGTAEAAVSAEELAIPGYDSLSAPQVVQRLAGLSAEELDAVRAYEAGTRHRKTILTRVSQLQSSQQH